MLPTLFCTDSAPPTLAKKTQRRGLPCPLSPLGLLARGSVWATGLLRLRPWCYWLHYWGSFTSSWPLMKNLNWILISSSLPRKKSGLKLHSEIDFFKDNVVSGEMSYWTFMFGRMLFYINMKTISFIPYEFSYIEVHMLFLKGLWFVMSEANEKGSISH